MAHWIEYLSVLIFQDASCDWNHHEIWLIAYASLSLSLIAYERYCKISNINSIINRISVKWLTLIIFIVSILLSIPDFLALAITYTGVDNVYIYTFTEFGKTDVYGIYLISLYAIIHVTAVISLTTINLLIVKGYRKFIISKMKLVKKNKNEKKDLKFQKTVTWIVSLL